MRIDGGVFKVYQERFAEFDCERHWDRLDKDGRQGFKDRLLVEDFESESSDTRRGDQVIFTRPSDVKF
jgi:hypothetical protein